MTETEKSVSKKRNPNFRIVALSLTLSQFADLQALMKEDNIGNFTFFVYSLILAEKKRRLSARGLGRPRKTIAPDQDPNRPRTIRNPFVDNPNEEHYMVNEYELALANAMQK